jgi:hypothetical protein
MSAVIETIGQTSFHHPIPSSPPLLQLERPVFANARDAVRFAYTREGSANRPASARMTDKTGSGGRGLGGNDGAAQAGIIVAVLRKIGPVFNAIVIADSVPPVVPCHCKRSCCVGTRMFTPWHDAIAALTLASILIPCRASEPLRTDLIMKSFTRGGPTLAKIAETHSIDPDTVTKHHRTITRWLKGAPAGKNGEEPVAGLNMRAWMDAESALHDVGITG